MLNTVSSLAILAFVAIVASGPASAEPVEHGPFAADTLSIQHFAGRLTIDTGSFDGIRLWLDGPAEELDALEILERDGTVIVEGSRVNRTSVTVVGDTNVTISGGGTAQVIVGGVQYTSEQTEPITMRVEMPLETAVDISGYVGTATLDDLDAPLAIELFSGEIRAGAVTDCALEVRGAGTIRVAGAKGGRLEMNLDGSGSIEVGTGVVEILSGAISGSGSLHFGGRADRAEINIDGVGTASVGHVDQRPLIAINGVGSVDVGNW